MQKEERGPPAAIELNIYSGLQITSRSPVYLVMQCASEKFNTATKAPPNPKWDESCKFTIKHSHLGLPSRPPEAVTITLREKDGSAIGILSIPIAKLGSEQTKKVWASFEPLEGGMDSPGKVSYDCWISEYSKARRHSLMEAISPFRPSKRHEPTRTHRPQTEMWTTDPVEESQHRVDRGSVAFSLSGSASDLREPQISKPTPSAPSPFRPEVTGISPSTGPGAGGIVVTVRGTMLGKDLDDVVSLTVCDIDCTGTLTYFSPSMLKFVVRPCPVRRELAGPIIVTTKTGGTGVCDLKFTFMAPFSSAPSANAPEVSGISPMYGPAGGGTPVRIFGSALGVDKSDLIGLTICGIDHLDAVTSVTPRVIHCTTQSGHGCGAIVVVTRSGGVGTSVVHYSYNRRLVMRSSTQGDDDDDDDELAPAVPEREPEKMSKAQLEAEVDHLRQTIKKLEERTDEQNKYIDRLISKLLELDPTGSFFEHC